MRVLFPQVSELSLNQAIFTDIASARLDTVTVALVRYSSRMPEATQAKMREYLEARLRHNDIRIVDVGHAINFSSDRK